MRVSRAAVAAKDERTPGYLAAVEAAATGGDDTHYDVPREAYRDIVARHGTTKPARFRRQVNLGDMAERVLSAVGITRERVQAWTGSKDCGCKRRQRAWNAWGHRQQARIERFLDAAARWYGFN